MGSFPKGTPLKVITPSRYPARAGTIDIQSIREGTQWREAKFETAS
jgi:hypothetical protein